MDIDALVDSLPEPVVTLIADLQDEVTALQKSLDEALAQEEEPVSPVEKALKENPDLAQILKAKDDRLAEIEKALEDARIAKADETWVSRARSFDGVVADPASFGRMMREINDFKPEYADAISKTLTAASERIRLSDLFSEGGHGASIHAGSAFEQATAIAKSMVEKGQATDIETARADVWDSHPHLYHQYQTERQAR